MVKMTHGAVRENIFMWLSILKRPCEYQGKRDHVADQDRHHEVVHVTMVTVKGSGGYQGQI